MFKSCGWSEEGVFNAFRKVPGILAVSERKFLASMSFLVDELGCELSEIRSHPLLFTFSLEKRLIPRHEVLKILKSKGLVERGVNLFSVLRMQENLFMKNFVLNFLDKAPELQEAYEGGMRT